MTHIVFLLLSSKPIYELSYRAIEFQFLIRRQTAKTNVIYDGNVILCGHFNKQSRHARPRLGEARSPAAYGTALDPQRTTSSKRETSSMRSAEAAPKSFRQGLDFGAITQHTMLHETRQQTVRRAPCPAAHGRTRWCRDVRDAGQADEY